MKTNYWKISKLSYKHEITVEPLQNNIWTVMFPECYDEENIKAFALDLLKNNINVEKTENNILIHEE